MNTGYYEAMFIINTGDDEESSRNAVLDEIVAEVKKHKGTVLNIDPMGKKQFTYTIAKKRDGYYYLIYIEIDTQAIQKMKEKFRINNRILREMFIRLEKEPQFNASEEGTVTESEVKPEPVQEVVEETMEQEVEEKADDSVPELEPITEEEIEE